jgi:hypothetical protein
MISPTSTILAAGAAGNFAGLVVPSSQSEAERFAGWLGMYGEEKRGGR